MGRLDWLGAQPNPNRTRATRVPPARDATFDLGWGIPTARLSGNQGALQVINFSEDEQY
jgi:hypothetical protein